MLELGDTLPELHDLHVFYPPRAGVCRRPLFDFYVARKTDENRD